MSEAIAEMVPLIIEKDLSLVGQAAKGLAVDNPVAVTLIGRTQRARLFVITAAAALAGTDCAPPVVGFGHHRLRPNILILLKNSGHIAIFMTIIAFEGQRCLGPCFLRIFVIVLIIG